MLSLSLDAPGKSWVLRLDCRGHGLIFSFPHPSSLFFLVCCFFKAIHQHWCHWTLGITLHWIWDALLLSPPWFSSFLTTHWWISSSLERLNWGLSGSWKWSLAQVSEGSFVCRLFWRVVGVGGRGRKCLLIKEIFTCCSLGKSFWLTHELTWILC